MSKIEELLSKLDELSGLIEEDRIALVACSNARLADEDDSAEQAILKDKRRALWRATIGLDIAAIATLLRQCREAGFIDGKGEVRKSGNPPDFHRLSDLSPEDLSLVEQMAAFICKAESIDDKQDSLNTMLEVLDQRPLEVVEFDRALADCHGTWSYFGSDYIEALRTARARVGEAFRQAVREVAKEADHDKA